MGNIWGSEKVRPINGTYLMDKPRRRRIQEARQKPLEVAAAPKEHWKVKALRIIHHIAERSRTFNREMLIQTEG